MLPSTLKQSSTPKKILQHSSLGKTAFYMTLIGDFFIFISAILNVFSGRESEDTGIGVIYLALIIPATIMAIYDLTKPDRKKTMPKAALILGLGMIPILMIIAIFVMIIFSATNK